jgi:hypothetical protein
MVWVALALHKHEHAHTHTLLNQSSNAQRHIMKPSSKTVTVLEVATGGFRGVSFIIYPILPISTPKAMSKH